MTPATGITAAFVDRILAVEFDALPRRAVEVAKQVVSDTLAVTLAGATRAADVARISIGYVREQGGALQASVVAGGFKTSMQNAAYVNGTLANVLEFDAAWSPPNHPASPTVPAIFAIAECRRLSGPAVLEAVVAAFEVQARIRLAGTGLSGGFHKPGVGFKAYPCIYLIHRAIDAALALRREFDIRPEQIDAVQIVQPPLHSVDRPTPKDALAANHSTQYATLIALLDGEVTIDSFSDGRLHAADVGALLPRVQYQADESIPATLEDMFATVNVTLKSGRQLSRRVDRRAGWMGNPLSREQQRAKFLSCARPLLDEKAAQRMLELADRIETLGDVGEIMDIARCDACNI